MLGIELTPQAFTTSALSTISSALNTVSYIIIQFLISYLHTNICLSTVFEGGLNIETVHGSYVIDGSYNHTQVERVAKSGKVGVKGRCAEPLKVFWGPIFS